MLGFLGRQIDRFASAVLAVVGAAGGSQAPAFIDQYLQRLGGRIDEAYRQQGLIETDATFLSVDATTRAVLFANQQARIADLEQARAALTDSGGLTQPIAFARHLDPDTARATLNDFTPAVPLDLAGIAYAGAGLLLALIVFGLGKTVLNAGGGMAIRRLRRPAKARPQSRKKGAAALVAPISHKI